MKNFYFARVNTLVCSLDLIADEEALIYVHFSHLGPVEAYFAKYIKEEFTLQEDTSNMQQYISQLAEYFERKRKKFTFNFALVGTPFQSLVWSELANIPYGQTISYKQLAANVGRPLAVRAVGGANNKNPLAIILPCHRVIGTNGNLTGYGGGLNIKEQLLALESIDSNSFS